MGSGSALLAVVHKCVRFEYEIKKSKLLRGVYDCVYKYDNFTLAFT